MGYLDDNLIVGERVTFHTRLHWSVYLTGWSLLTLGFVGWLRRRSSEFVVTNHRVMIKVGIFSTRTLELNLSKIESVSVHQSLTDKVQRRGDIEIVGSGGTRERFAGIALPLEFRKAVQEATYLLSERATT